MCVWIKVHLSAKSVKIVAVFYLYRGKIQILSSLLSKWKDLLLLSCWVCAYHVWIAMIYQVSHGQMFIKGM